MPILVRSLLRKRRGHEALGTRYGEIYAANSRNPEARTAGDKTVTLTHFMDVYGSNFDYRGVTERIRALKS